MPLELPLQSAVRSTIQRESVHPHYKVRDLGEFAKTIAAQTTSDETAALALIVSYLCDRTNHHSNQLSASGGF